MNFVFKIFGVPHIFDIYQGNENEVGYFQTFYNGSEENVKFIIHRMETGQVSYTYLRYNLISGSGRPNAFLGMSVVFKKEYCTDVENLYKLFDSVYKTILQNKILFEEVKGNPHVQAKYLVGSFADANNEVKRIENIICKNIEKEFATDIHPLDIPPGIPNLIRKLSNKKKNAAILAAFSKYSWVYISPDYNDEEGLSQEVIEPILDRIKHITHNLSNIIAEKKVDITIKQIEVDINTIQPYLKTQPELQKIEQELNNTKKQLKELDDLMKKEKIGSGDLVKNDVPAEDTTSANSTKQNTPKAQTQILWWKRIFNKLFSKTKENNVTKYSDTDNYKRIIEKGDSSFYKTPYSIKNINEAKRQYTKAQKINNVAPNVVAKYNAEERIQKANNMAIEFLKKSAEKEFKKGGTGKTEKITGYKNAVSKLEQISKQQYGKEDDYKNDTDKYKKQTIDYYVKKQNNTAEKLLKYVEIISNLDEKPKKDLDEKLKAIQTLLTVN